MYFDKFYSKKYNKNIEIDDIVDDMVSSIKFFIKFGKEIYCPECKKAKLKYTSRSDSGDRKPFISAIRVEKHGEGCNYKYEYVNNTEFKLIVNSRLNVNTLERIVDRMLINSQYANGSNKEDSSDDTIVVHDIQKSTITVKRKVFKKSINNINLADKNYYYYYGKTQLSYINNYYKNIIKVRINNKQIHYFNIVLSNKINIDLDEKKLYCISFFANVSEKEYNGVKYPEVILLNNDCICIKEYIEM